MNVIDKTAFAAVFSCAIGAANASSYTFTNLALGGFGNGGSAAAQEFSINNAG